MFWTSLHMFTLKRKYNKLALVYFFQAGNISLLCYVKPIMIFLGALPYQLVSINKRVYTIYKYTLQGTFLLVLLFFHLEIPRLHGPIDKIFQSVSMLITYSIMYVKGLVCMSKNINDLVVEMVSYESAIKTSKREDIFRTYSLVVKRSKAVQMYYIILTYLTGIAFFLKAFQNALTSDEIKFNSTMEAHESLPYAMWLPLDENEHYMLALTIQTFCALLAINYYCFVQCILVILPLSVTLRLKILANNLKNIKSSGNISSFQFGDTETLDGINELVNLCIKEHLDIIE